MWLLTAVGPVHGQLSTSDGTGGTSGDEVLTPGQGFTFVLARSKSYTVGRDKQTDIRFDSKHVRPTEGTLHVGGWDPSQVSRSRMVPRGSCCSAKWAGRAGRRRSWSGGRRSARMELRSNRKS